MVAAWHNCGVRQPGVRMTTQEEEHAGLEWCYPDRLQTSSEVPVQLQHQFQQRQFFIAVVLNSLHGQCVVPFAMRLLIDNTHPCFYNYISY